jgi:hypothetical protein
MVSPISSQLRRNSRKLGGREKGSPFRNDSPGTDPSLAMAIERLYSIGHRENPELETVLPSTPQSLQRD